MTKLTIALDEATLERARRKASQGVEEDREPAVRVLLDLSRAVESGSGGRRWTRDELHDRY
jgi:hypothetical protein